MDPKAIGTDPLVRPAGPFVGKAPTTPAKATGEEVACRDSYTPAPSAQAPAAPSGTGKVPTPAPVAPEMPPAPSAAKGSPPPARKTVPGVEDTPTGAPTGTTAQVPAGWNVAGAPTAEPAPVLHAPGFDPGNLDPTVPPSQDFFTYANGGWIQKNPIPEELPRWGRFTELAESNQAKLREIVEEVSTAPAPPGSLEQKIGDFYASGMDTAAIEAAGTQPLQPLFDRINAVQDLAGLQKVVAELHRDSVDVFFGVGSMQDFKDSTQVIGDLGQGGLGLPDRDYYTKDDERSQKLREQYVEHVAKMFELLGDAPDVAAAEAKTVMAIETNLAENSMTRVELRDPKARYHRMGMDDVNALAPAIDWKAYVADIGLEGLPDINVGQVKFFGAMSNLLKSTPIDDLKTYMRWHLIDSTARHLSSSLVDEDFRFKGTVLSGTPQNRPRWKRIIGATDGALGEAVGKLFVDRHFSPEAKARVKDMVSNIKAALREDLETLPWMSPETRQNAIAKMDAFEDKLGYPDKWTDYSKLEIDRGPFVLNILRSRQFAFDKDLDKIGKPLDRTEWHMSPSTVNAYYNPTMNEIVFPAGILQPPFFDANADDAINYGGIGAVIGHEMTHGFDDKGSQFAANGNLENWWTDEDKANFEARTALIEKQYEGYEIEPGVHMNGKLVKGEAIADLGGLVLAQRAFERAQKGKPAPGKIDGFTPQQRFFLGFAQVWGGAVRPEYARMQAATDPHPHQKFRVNGTLGNMPEFAEAFGVKPGDPMMLPEDQRTVIW